MLIYMCYLCWHIYISIYSTWLLHFMTWCTIIWITDSFYIWAYWLEVFPFLFSIRTIVYSFIPPFPWVLIEIFWNFHEPYRFLKTYLKIQTPIPPIPRNLNSLPEQHAWRVVIIIIALILQKKKAQEMHSLIVTYSVDFFFFIFCRAGDWTQVLELLSLHH
jgi:hypothetical protein